MREPGTVPEPGAEASMRVATTIIIKSGKARYAWVTALPLVWLVTITTSAAWHKLFSPELRVGFLAHARDLSATGETWATACNCS